jgi:hypothetical protein
MFVPTTARWRLSLDKALVKMIGRTTTLRMCSWWEYQNIIEKKQPLCCLELVTPTYGVRHLLVPPKLFVGSMPQESQLVL